MNNILGDGEKPEIIKIMPFGKTLALALMVALSGCKEDIAHKEVWGKEPILAWNVTLYNHPDYILEEKPCQDSASFAWCTEKKVILKHGGNIYVRAELDSNGAPILYVGSYDANDTIESEMWNGILEIQNQ